STSYLRRMPSSDHTWTTVEPSPRAKTMTSFSSVVMALTTLPSPTATRATSGIASTRTSPTCKVINSLSPPQTFPAATALRPRRAIRSQCSAKCFLAMPSSLIIGQSSVGDLLAELGALHGLLSGEPGTDKWRDVGQIKHARRGRDVGIGA